jgi:CheY-like chemotaxis protein
MSFRVEVHMRAREEVQNSFRELRIFQTVASKNEFAGRVGGGVSRVVLKDGPMKTILVLDDETIVRNVVRQALVNAGFTVLAVATAEEAIKAAAAEPGEMSLFITNHLLPGGKNGREIAQGIRERRPALPVLHISGSVAVRMLGKTSHWS